MKGLLYLQTRWTAVLAAVLLYASTPPLQNRADEPAAPSVAHSPTTKTAPETAGKPKDIGCGEVINVGVSAAPVLWRDLDRLLLDERFEPSDADDETTLIRRPPRDGCVYLIVDVKLRPGRSIGKYDWKLKHGDRVWSCLAISRDRLPYDPRTWQIEYIDELTVYHLLFEIPKGIREGLLVFALPVTIPVPPVELRWSAPGESPEEPASRAKTPSPTPAAPPAAAPDAKPGGKGDEPSEEKPE